MSQADAANTVEDSAIDEVLSYLRTVVVTLPAPVTLAEELEPLALPISSEVLEREILALPEDQLVHQRKKFKVFVGSADQLPHVLAEITRLREYTFRAYEEGSGRAVDTDRFDQDYLHLFAWDEEARAIVGGYRLGQTDKLRAEHGPEGVYLSTMFDFDDAFFAGSPMLEIGRSFVTPEYQRHHLSLYLLWSGISRYLVKHPGYRRVYGVVSMSRLYDGRTSAAIRDALLEPDTDVEAKDAYTPDLGDPWHQFLAQHPLSLREVSRIVKSLEQGERDIPVLIRHYHKLGARFVSAAVDGSFNNTPGLLLCLDVPQMPYKYMKQYFGEGADQYLNYSN